MVTSALIGHGDPILTDIVERKIPPEHFLYIGLKDIDQAEIDFLASNSLTCFTMLDVVRYGLAPIMEAIQTLAQKVDRIWISIDMDSIDQEYAPGVGLPNYGGLTRREILGLVQYIGKTCPVAGFDIVEVSPPKDIDGKTTRLALEIIARLLGTEYSWYNNEYIASYRNF